MIDSINEKFDIEALQKDFDMLLGEGFEILLEGVDEKELDKWDGTREYVSNLNNAIREAFENGELRTRIPNYYFKIPYDVARKLMFLLRNHGVQLTLMHMKGAEDRVYWGNKLIK